MIKICNDIGENQKNLVSICKKIEENEEYMVRLKESLNSINAVTTELIELLQKPDNKLELNITFYMQILNDIIYGIENEDSVFLLDVLRYGLLEVYKYIEMELVGEEA